MHSYCRLQVAVFLRLFVFPSEPSLATSELDAGHYRYDLGLPQVLSTSFHSFHVQETEQLVRLTSLKYFICALLFNVGS
jgi:hypothetical protein